MKRIVTMMFLGLIGCGSSPLVGTWSNTQQDITFNAGGLMVPGKYDASAAFSADKSTVVTLTFNVVGSMLQATATGTWSDDGKKLTLNVSDLKTSTATAQATKDATGNFCLSTMIAGNPFAVCFAATQSNDYAIAGTVLTTSIGYFFPTTPPTSGTIALTLNKKE